MSSLGNKLSSSSRNRAITRLKRGSAGPAFKGPQLARLLLALFEGQERLSLALRRLGSDVKHPGPEDPHDRILLTERLAKPRGDLGLHRRVVRVYHSWAAC